MNKAVIVASSLKRLLENALKVSRAHEDEVLNWQGLVKAKVGGQELCLPGYIPYIGSKYFDSETEGCRILAYALSQNLRPDCGLAIRWAEDWHKGDGMMALDRQNKGYASSDRRAEMHPFDTGHIPVLCALLRWIVRKGLSPISSSIYDETTATNLSKFSFRTANKERTTDKMDSLQRCWEWFSKEEIEVLQPDFILCAGNDVYHVVSSGLKELKVRGYDGPSALKVAFPNLLVINRYYNKKPIGKHLTTNDILELLSDDDIKHPVDYKNLTLGDIVKRDTYYFAEMHSSMKDQLSYK